MKKIFTTEATNVGGRNGKVLSQDKKIDLEVAMPEEMGGQKTDATNPEQLFAAGYSSCLNGALQLILQKSKVEFEETSVTAQITLLEDPADHGFKLSAHLIVALKGVDREKAEKYVPMAHAFCPYSKAIKDQVPVTIEIQTS